MHPMDRSEDNMQARFAEAVRTYPDVRTAYDAYKAGGAAHRPQLMEALNRHCGGPSAAGILCEAADRTTHTPIPPR